MVKSQMAGSVGCPGPSSMLGHPNYRPPDSEQMLDMLDTSDSMWIMRLCVDFDDCRVVAI